MNRILCVIGPTATGKTKKAIELSREQPSVLISADSRQVYRGMDIVTGKDHPRGVKILGIDIVEPDEPISVSVWYDVVMPLIKLAWQEGKLPIIVGGTGLYVSALTHGIATMQVPINQPLRDELNTLSIRKLQERLTKLNHTKLDSMNHSDRLNPRRLIRAIEVATAPSLPLVSAVWNLEYRILGLRYHDPSIHRDNVHKRVLERIESGAIQETQDLLSKYDPTLQSMTAIGYRSIAQYLDKQISRDEMIEQWVLDEVSYAKRQMTWFRKYPVIWYDVDNNKE